MVADLERRISPSIEVLSKPLYLGFQRGSGAYCKGSMSSLITFGDFGVDFELGASRVDGLVSFCLFVVLGSKDRLVWSFRALAVLGFHDKVSDSE